MEIRFFKCKHCGKIIAVMKDTKVDTICCGEAMMEIIPGTVDASKEKHVPVLEVIDNVAVVKVGSIEHPMADAHYIEWIMIQTNYGNKFCFLKPGLFPAAKFALLDDEEVIATYAYCNLHGLWKN